MKAGIDPALIVLHGNAKSDEEIALAVEHGVGIVAVDNSDDVDRLGDHCRRAVPGCSYASSAFPRTRTATC